MSASECAPSNMCIEEPSGKTASRENFPVGSWLLSARLRPHIHAFYAFARTIDDIADSSALRAEEKLRRLDGFERVLRGSGAAEKGYEKGLSVLKSLQQTNITVQHCLDLITAFRQDAIRSRYETWDDLLAYCQLSAAPVGRYLIDLHGGCEDNYKASDALCAALQIINHLQDIKADAMDIDRIYLPTTWMESAGVTTNDLLADNSSQQVRALIDRALSGIDDLLATAAPVSRVIRSGRLGMEASVIFAIARRLRLKLSRHDPLMKRVVLSKTQLAACFVRGAVSAVI